ncbi:MAG: hypothetical protein HY769_03460, partial [Candidatus Stahlbacteria bacterium]|nr:hypothetical protein [Candidatus Stahlbacteria bacterium]
MCKYKALVILGVVYANLLMAGEIVRTENFNLQDFKFDKIDSFDVVKLNGAFFTQKVGTPLLPIKTISVLIPAGAEVLKIEIVNHKSEVIPGKYNIYPAQPPTPISYWGEIKFANPTKEIYEMQNEYPGKLIEISNIGSICGYKIVNIMFYPVQYIPKDRQVIFYNTIEFKILYKEGVGSNIYPNAQQLVKDRVKHLVVNPEDIGVFAPVQKISKSSPFLPADTVDYVIITSTQFDTVFQRLAYWKTKKGISSKVITTNWIYANYTGRDNPEKIRNFIKDATSTWGAIYFLLGGQCDFENGQEVVPRRDVYYYTSGVNIYPDEDTIPSDLYYSDLDRTWDDDNDGIWGEAPANGDTVDLYADVFVGRAPCFTLTQAQTFVNKVLTYEKNPGISYLKKLFLPAGILWDYYQGDTITQNLISDMLPADWQKSKLYERRGNLTQAAAVCSMNVGFALGHFVGHGNENGIYYGPGAYLNSTDADTLSNMPKIGIYNAISCMTGAIDYVTGGDCFAEILVNNPDGGVFASIMNTRYGWGNPPTMGPSEFIDTCFFNQIFCHSNYKLGKAHAYAKDGAVPYSWVNIWPWCIYELTLFGDPETDIWTDTPDTFEVVHNGVVPIGATSFSIIVRSGGIAVESAYVCLYKMNEVYSLAYTDINGNAVLTMSPPITHDTLYITITKHNYIPKESYAMVISPSGPYLIYQKYEIDDNNSGQSSGDNDSLIDAGETIELPIWVKNVGIDTAKNVTGILRTQDTFVTIIDSTDYFGNVFPNSTVRCTGNFVFQVDMNCPNNHSILFTIVMKDALDSVWTANFGVPVPAPIINYVDYVLDDDNTGQSSGNNDGYASPNERIELTIRLKNIGPVAADSVKSKLSTFDTFITVIDSIKGYGNILKDSVRSSIFPYVFDVASNCPRNHSVKFYLHSWDNNPATKDWVDSFNIKIWYPAQIMLVSKDPNYINYFTQALDSLNYSYDIYEGITIPANVNKFGSKNTISGVTVAGDTSIMKLYPIIVWSTGDLTSGTITENEQSALIWWLNRGGKLFVTGQDIGFDLQYNGLSFYNNYLHARYINDATDIDSLIGISGDLISDGIGLKISGGDGANNQSFPSEIDTMNGSSYVFQYVGDGYGAVNFFGTYKVVYFAFGFEGINNFITRKLVMQRVLEALGGPAVQYINVAPIYSSPQDTVVIYAKIIGDSITSCLTEIESPDEIVIDTVYLYDDGSHSDSAANDLVFANIWVTEATSKKYWVDLHVIDTEGYRVDINNGTWFSTFTPPVINLTPTAFSKTLVKDTSTVDTLWIWNTGESDLYFQIDMSYDSSSSLMTKLSIPKDNRFNNQININTFNPLYTTKHKPNDHWEAGPAVPFGFGGPDSFGYLWIDS